MKLSIVIVNWNTGPLLHQCIRSIYQNPPGDSYEILVVDNASHDGSTDFIPNQYPEIILLSNSENLGFARGNNVALEQCTGEYILLLNPDTEVFPEAIDILIDFLDAHPKAGGASSRLLNPDGSLQASCYPFPTLSRELWRLLHLDRVLVYGIYDQEKWDLNQTYTVDVTKGAAFMVRKQILDQIGFFDPEYFMYTEEVDLCLRIRQNNWDLYWVPQSKIMHYEGQSTKQVPVEMFLQLYKTKLQFIRKHYGTVAANLYKVILAIISIPRLFLIPYASLLPPDHSEKYAKIGYNYQRLLSSIWDM